MSAGRAGRGTVVAAVLFDLDGTLLDTAPDLVGALNHLRVEEGHEPVAVADYRRFVSRGALGLIRAGMPDRGPAVEADRRSRFLAWYEKHLFDDSRPFPGVDLLLDAIESRGLPWAVVTNKPTFLTEPLLAALGWDRRAAAVVCGDTLTVSKPDPAPVLFASERLGVPAQRAAMVGDDPRDLDAAEAAGSVPVLATYGYGALEVLDSDRAPTARVDRPEDLLSLLDGEGPGRPDGRGG
jgi:phosphoglycolate phosphatase